MKLDLDRAWGRRSPDQIRALQDRKLRRFVSEQLVPFSPFYRRLFREHGIDPRQIRTVDDLSASLHVQGGRRSHSRRAAAARDLVLAPTRELIQKLLAAPAEAPASSGRSSSRARRR